MSNPASSDSNSSAPADSLSCCSSNSTAISSSEEYPISVAYFQWGDCLSAARPKMPLELFHRSVDRSVRDAGMKAYGAKADAAMKDILAEYDKWLKEHDEELGEWLNSCGGNDEPDGICQCGQP